ncbi:septum formation initiator family protein [Pseudonocardia hispaniensis]|uniref:Septum formation initiator family protein n=1 Tax=Pseudonocardia hispaniensis TaxID=904933 RepID=A0ABW1IZG2_9PSEU
MSAADERGRSRSDRVRFGRGAAPPRPAATGRRTREPRLTRTRARAVGVVAATTDWLGVSSARRAAVLAFVACAIALSVAVPLRNFLTQRQELAAVSEQQRALAAEVDELTRRRAELADPDRVVADARSRLGYVRPGEVPFIVQLPEPVRSGPGQDGAGDAPWYARLWREVSEGTT